MKKILIVSTISLAALFGISQIDFSNDEKENPEKHIKTTNKNEENNKKNILITSNDNHSNIKKCKSQILPTKVDQALFNKIYETQQKNGKNENCKDIYLNILKNNKLAKTFIKNKQTNENIYNGIDLSNGLDIEYFDEETKTITLFEEIEPNDNWDLSFLEKYQEEYDIEKHFLNSNLNIIENALFLQLNINKIKENSDNENLKNFPIQNVTFKYKGETHKYKLKNISDHGNGFGVSFITTDTPPQYAKTFTMVGSFVYREKNKNYKPRATIEIKNNGTASIKEINNKNSILLFSTIKK